MFEQMDSRWARFKLQKSLTEVDHAVRYLVHHAASRVPFYRARWSRSGASISRVSRASDLPHLPITARQDLMLAGTDAFLRNDRSHGRLVTQHTTGTSGTPIAVYMSPLEARFRTLTVFQSFRHNAKLGLAWTIADVGPQRKDRTTRTVVRFGGGTLIRLFAGMPMEEQISLLKRYRPTLIEGRPSSLWELSRAMQETSTCIASPRLVVSFGEMLYPHVRTYLEKTFSCHVTDYYNCEEIGNIAWQCPEHPSRMHVNLGAAWVEVLGRNGETLPLREVGDVIVTNLYNLTMPFIRYAIGDRASMHELGRCSCGYDGQTLRRLEGRDEDFLRLPDGREVSPREVFSLLNRALLSGGDDVLVRSIRGFRLIQESINLLVIRVIPGPDYEEGIWSSFQDEIRILHPSIRTRIERVNSFGNSGSGEKVRCIVSLVDTQWHALRTAGNTGD